MGGHVFPSRVCCHRLVNHPLCRNAWCAILWVSMKVLQDQSDMGTDTSDSMFLAVWGTQANVPATLAYGQNQTARIDKRGVVSAAMISIGAAGGVAGSTIFRSQDAPVSH